MTAIRTRAGVVRRCRRALRGESGEVSVELVLATPLLLGLLLVIVQCALWSHATHIAQAAATQALAATRTLDGTTTTGRSGGETLLHEMGDGPLRGARITLTRTPARATVEVRGYLSPLLPGLHLPVHARVTGPVERLTPDTGPPRPR